LTAQNAPIWTAILVIGIQCVSAQIGGYFEVVAKGSVRFRDAPPAAAR